MEIVRKILKKDGDHWSMLKRTILGRLKIRIVLIYAKLFRRVRKG